MAFAHCITPHNVKNPGWRTGAFHREESRETLLPARGSTRRAQAARAISGSLLLVSPAAPMAVTANQ